MSAAQFFCSAADATDEYHADPWDQRIKDAMAADESAYYAARQAGIREKAAA